MPRFLLRASALALAVASPVLASESVTKDQVLDAIRVFEANAAGSLTAQKSADEANSAVATASNTILKFALESDLVVIDLGTDSVPWCDVKKGLSELSNSGERGLLLAAYLSGCVKAQLLSGKQDPNPYPGWVAMLRVYHASRSRRRQDPRGRSPAGAPGGRHARVLRRGRSQAIKREPAETYGAATCLQSRSSRRLAAVKAIGRLPPP